MRFTADYANDHLRKLENLYASGGKSIEYIYTDPQFIEECKQQHERQRLEVNRLIQNNSRYLAQYRNRCDEAKSMRCMRGSTDEKVYRRLMDNTVRRRRKTFQRYARTEASLVTAWNLFKGLDVLRYAQITKLRRFWDHPSYKIEKLSPKELYDVIDSVRIFSGLEEIKLAA